MPTQGYTNFFIGGVRWSYHAPFLAPDMARRQVEYNTAEFQVHRAAPGEWEGTISSQGFGGIPSNNLLGTYIDDGTTDIPVTGFFGRTTGDIADIFLMGPIVRGLGPEFDADKVWRRTVDTTLHSREPMTDGYTLYFSAAAGVTGAVSGTGHNTGAVIAGKELVVAVHHGHWPTLGGTAAATYKLQSHPDNTWSAPVDEKTWTPTTGNNPAYQVWTIDGDSPGTYNGTNAWWRLDISAVTATVWPCAAIKLRTKNE